MNFKIIIFNLIFHLICVSSESDFCNHIRYGLSLNALTDEFNETIWEKIMSCSKNVCAHNPCDSIQNAKKASCTPLENALFENDFECKCLENSFWSKTLKKCIIDNRCLDEATCGGPLRSEKCIFNDLNGHVKCKCKIEWMGENCERERDACVENYHEHLANGKTYCEPNGICKGFYFFF